jgi:hypothetical protein
MLNDKELYHYFKSNKQDVPDEGFSKRVMKHLPKRCTILAPLITVFCTVWGFACTVAIQEITQFVEQIARMMSTIAHSFTPLSPLIVTYLSALAIAGTVAFAIAHIDFE